MEGLPGLLVLGGLAAALDPSLAGWVLGVCGVACLGILLAELH